MGEGRSQCVVTRRKRSPEEIEKESMEGMAYAASLNNNEGDDEDEDGDDDDDDTDDENVNKDKIKVGASASAANHKVGIKNDEEDDEEDYDDDEDDDEPFHPIIVQHHVALQNGAQSSIAVGASTHASAVTPAVAGGGLVLIQSHSPPVVDPETHAVFQLVPVSAGGNLEDDDAEDLYYQEDLEPVTTTAIWTTGVGDDDIIPFKKVTKNKNGAVNKNKRKGGNKKRRPVQKRRRPGQKNRRPLAGKRRPVKKQNKLKRRPSNKRRKTNKRKNKKPSKNGIQSSKNKKVKAKRKSNKQNVQNKRKNSNKHDKLDQGTRTFTKTVTVTNDDNDEKDVNCIYINKAPTTARPFWNILGRNAENADENRSFKYGNRKRANVRFVA